MWWIIWAASFKFLNFHYSHGNVPVSVEWCTLSSWMCLSPTTHSWRDENSKDTSSQRTLSHQRRTKSGLAEVLHFLFVTGMLAVVGSRVASLVLLEFCLRAVSGWVTAGPVRNQLCDKNSYTWLSAVRPLDFLTACIIWFCWVNFIFFFIQPVTMTHGLCSNKQAIICSHPSVSSAHVLLYSHRTPGNFCCSCWSRASSLWAVL